MFCLEISAPVQARSRMLRIFQSSRWILPIGEVGRTYRIKCRETEKGAECVEEVSQRPLAESSEKSAYKFTSQDAKAWICCDLAGQDLGSMRSFAREHEARGTWGQPAAGDCV
jgi:hypothetical protein